MQTCMLVYDISVPTFRRYMADLRAFFTEKYGLEIKYISAKKGYFLTPNPFIENIENQQSLTRDLTFTFYRLIFFGKNTFSFFYLFYK